MLIIINIYNLNNNKRLFLEIIADLKRTKKTSKIYSKYYQETVNKILPGENNLLNKYKPLFLNIEPYQPESQDDPNQVRAYEKRDYWLHDEMDVETQKLHLTLMDILLNYDLAQLDSTFPEIVQNPNRLCSAHFHLYGEHVSQYTKKHKHLEDLISSKIYQGLDHPITKKQLDLTTIQSIKLMEVITDQVEEFINDKTTIKKFGFTIVNKKLGAILPNYDFQQNNTLTKDTLIPWYSPVIICLHEPSQFCCLIDIDKLASKEGKSKFKTAYALDEYQELSNSLYNFICARNSDSRVFDAILESIDHQTLVNKILLKDTNLPPSFIRLLDHPTFKGYIELKKSIEELGDTE